MTCMPVVWMDKDDALAWLAITTPFPPYTKSIFLLPLAGLDPGNVQQRHQAFPFPSQMHRSPP